MPLWDIGWLQEPAAVVLLQCVFRKCSAGLLRQKKRHEDMEERERKLQREVEEYGNRRPDDMKIEEWLLKGSEDSRCKEEKRNEQKRRKGMKTLYEVWLYSYAI